MADPENILEVRHLCRHFSTGRGRSRTTVKAVDDVSFCVRKAETFGLVGESGCGKTTTGRTIIRLYDPSSGEILFDGREISGKMTPEKRRYLTDNIAMIFQDPIESLNPRMTIEEIVGEGLKLRGVSDKRERHRRVVEMLNKVGLTEEHAARYPHEFSGGQRQRIGIARALAVEPDFIVADEPVSALDVSVQAQVLNLLQDLQRDLGLTMLFVAHDLAVVDYLCDEVVVMYLGRVMERGPTSEVYARPRHPYTRALLSAAPVPDPRAPRSRILLKGDIPSPVNPPSGCVFRTRCPHSIEACASTEARDVNVGPGHFAACSRLGDPELAA